MAFPGFYQRMGFHQRGTFRLPATTVAGQLTVNENVLGARFLAEDDTVGAPGFSYQNDGDSGMARQGANIIAIVSAGGANFQASQFSSAEFKAMVLSAGFQATAETTPAILGASQNDWAGYSTGSIPTRVSASLAINITGLNAGNDGSIISLQNIGTFNITLTNEDAASAAANRFALGANLVLTPELAVLLRYDAVSSRWRRL